MEYIDLRSDTVSCPTPGMRSAIANAPVGDDVYGEDPTVNRLQDVAAERTGKEAGLFVPSGSMANQIAVRLQTRPGDVVLAGSRNHVLRYEAGSAAALAGVQLQTLGESGLFGAEDIRSAATLGNLHVPATTLCMIENTHNAGGGLAWPHDQLLAVTKQARRIGLALHLDGARIFNAAIATGHSAEEIAAPFDSATFCLSKGLGAPVGSVLVGTRDFIEKARAERKRLGGAMRQAGILAAAGLYALDHHVDRLADDHRNATRLADGLRKLGFAVDDTPETNMVMFRVADQNAFQLELEKKKVRISPIDAERMRAVTHLDVSTDDIDQTLSRCAEVGPF